MQTPGGIVKGKKYNRLMAVKFVGVNKHRSVQWEFECECGTVVVCDASSVKRNVTKSCGCLRREQLKTHGLTETPEYNIWSCMKARCYREYNDHYYIYGARGITVCDEWKNSFITFYEDMGPRPEGMSLDRIDNDKGYSKENCRWATDAEQRANRSDNVKLVYKGKEVLLTHFAKELGVGRRTVKRWMSRGLNGDEIAVYVFNINGRVWHPSTVISYISCDPGLCVDFSKLFKHDNYIVVSRTVKSFNDITYNLVAKGNKKDYAYLHQ